MAQDLQSRSSTISGSTPASAEGSGRTSGMTQNRQCAFRAKIDLETCIGLISSAEDHALIDRWTAADSHSWLNGT